MATNLTNKGQEYALYGTATPNGGIANLATRLRVYSSTSTPAKNGTGFTQLASGNGYPVNGWAISRASWTFSLVGDNQQIKLADQTLTASGPVPNIGGSYILDASDNVLAWWELASPLSLLSTDAFFISLSIRLQ